MALLTSSYTQASYSYFSAKMKFPRLVFIIVIFVFNLHASQGLIQEEQLDEEAQNGENEFYAGTGLSFLLETYNNGNESEGNDPERIAEEMLFEYLELSTWEWRNLLERRIELLQDQVELNKEALDSTNVVTSKIC